MSKKRKLLPDPSISIADMFSYGYHIDDILPLTEPKAEELYDKNSATIFLLYSDNTKGTANNIDDIFEHNSRGGIFGIEKKDWEQIRAAFI